MAGGYPSLRPGSNRRRLFAGTSLRPLCLQTASTTKRRRCAPPTTSNSSSNATTSNSSSATTSNVSSSTSSATTSNVSSSTSSATTSTSIAASSSSTARVVTVAAVVALSALVPSSHAFHPLPPPQASSSSSSSSSFSSSVAMWSSHYHRGEQAVLGGGGASMLSIPSAPSSRPRRRELSPRPAAAMDLMDVSGEAASRVGGKVLLDPLRSLLPRGLFPRIKVLPRRLAPFLDRHLRLPLARLLSPSSPFSHAMSLLLRLTITPLLLLALLHPLPGLNARLSSFYTTTLLPSRLLHWPMLDAVWAVTSFLISWVLFLVPGALLGVPRLDGKTAPRKTDVWFWAMANIVVYLGAVQLLIMMVPVKVPPLHACSIRRLLGETVLGLFLYDMCFYPIHAFLHRAPLRAVREIHAVHHDGYSQAQLTPISTVVQHWFDTTLQVGVNIMVQNLSIRGVRKHPLSRLLHNFLVPYLLVEAHSGMDLPWMSHRIFPAIFGGSVRHESHHQQGNEDYHQFFKYIDDFRRARRRRRRM